MSGVGRLQALCIHKTKKGTCKGDGGRRNRSINATVVMVMLNAVSNIGHDVSLEVFHSWLVTHQCCGSTSIRSISEFQFQLNLKMPRYSEENQNLKRRDFRNKTQ